MTATSPPLHAPPIGTRAADDRPVLWRRLVRGRPEDPTWVRPALWTLLAATGVLYLWTLGESGWGNSFYAAAVQAGTESWKAFFFGSSDAANSITVDKTPASLWIMSLSGRIFGVNSWSMLVPEALEGVATVGLLYGAVRRWASPAAGLLAGAALALTPVATLMFRFNNPDALLTLALVGAAYCVVRATEVAGTRWLIAAGSLIGLGFLTKMLQAFLLLPVLALVYLVAAPTSVRRRIWQLLLGGVAVLVSAGWWVAIVELWPASSRPYIGGSQNNSIMELVLGYNGLGRLTGNETGSVMPGGGGPPGGGTSRWGETGLARMFNGEIGGQISWLIPAALIFLVTMLWFSRRAPRTDRIRASLLLWGGWLLVTGLVFSYMQGIFHAYYTVALAPGVAALVGIGAVTFWRQRESGVARGVLALALAATAAWAWVLLGRSTDWLPWLRFVIVAGAALSVVGLLLARLVPRRLVVVVVGAALVTALAGPAAYAIQTTGTPHEGAIVSAGPAGARGGGPGGMRGGGRFGAGQRPPGFPQGALPPGVTLPPGAQLPGGQNGPGGMRGGGGFLQGSTPSAALVTLLDKDADRYTWVAAAIGSNSASGYQLATGDPVMAIGGFNGSDPSPTLEQFKQYVADGKIHYFIGGGIGGTRNGGSDASSKISEWVLANFKATTVGGTTLYDLTASTAGTTGT
jgi:4-amino-4-deoxy-L-arabinose transferase-like glycosyltransferase